MTEKSSQLGHSKSQKKTKQIVKEVNREYPTFASHYFVNVFGDVVELYTSKCSNN